MSEEPKDKIRETPLVRLIQFARKLEDDEMVYHFIDVRGNDALGYVAHLDVYFIPMTHPGRLPEYVETIYESEVYANPGWAADAIAFLFVEQYREEGREIHYIGIPPPTIPASTMLEQPPTE